MASVIAGLAGGIVATIVMTIVMRAMGGGSPPTSALVAKLAGGEPDEYMMPGMLLHLLYGTIAGAVFAIGVPFLGLSLGSIGIAIGLGVVYGLVLMVGGMVFWMRIVIGMEADAETMKRFGTVHVVYGLVLGAFLGLGIVA